MKLSFREFKVKSRKMMDIFYKDLPLFLLCLFLAVVTWAIVAIKEEGLYTLNIKLKYKGYSPNLIIDPETNSMVKLTMNGPVYKIKKYQRELPAADIILNKTNPGKFIYKLTNNDFPIFSEMRIQSIEPQELEIILSKKSKRIVQVDADIRGKISDDYELVSVSVIPPKVTIEGAAQIIRNMTKINTLPINIDDLKASLKTNVNLKIDQKSIKIDKEDVMVKIEVKEKYIQRQIETSIIISDSDLNKIRANNYKLIQDYIKIYLEGPSTIVKIINKQDILVKGVYDEKNNNIIVNAAKTPAEIKIMKLEPEIIKLVKKEKLIPKK